MQAKKLRARNTTTASDLEAATARQKVLAIYEDLKATSGLNLEAATARQKVLAIWEDLKAAAREYEIAHPSTYEYPDGPLPGGDFPGHPEYYSDLAQEIYTDSLKRKI